MDSSHPDADLHPHATGPAAKIVAAHTEDEPLKLYSGWFCPYVLTECCHRQEFLPSEAHDLYHLAFPITMY